MAANWWNYRKTLQKARGKILLFLDDCSTLPPPELLAKSKTFGIYFSPIVTSVTFIYINKYISLHLFHMVWIFIRFAADIVFDYRLPPQTLLGMLHNIWYMHGGTPKLWKILNYESHLVLWVLDKGLRTCISYPRLLLNLIFTFSKQQCVTWLMTQ
jgi:hypothetical protein